MVDQALSSDVKNATSKVKKEVIYLDEIYFV